MSIITGRRSKGQYKLSLSNKAFFQLLEILTDALIAEGKRTDRDPREVWKSLADKQTSALARIIMGVPMFAIRAPALFGAIIEDYPAKDSPQTWEWETYEQLQARGARFLSDTGPKDIQMVIDAFLASAEFSEIVSMIPDAIEEKEGETENPTTSTDTQKDRGKSGSNGEVSTPQG